MWSKQDMESRQKDRMRENVVRKRYGKRTEGPIKERTGERNNRRRTDHYSLPTGQGPNLDVIDVNIEWCSLLRKPIQKFFVLDVLILSPEKLK